MDTEIYNPVHFVDVKDVKADVQDVCRRHWSLTWPGPARQPRVKHYVNIGHSVPADSTQYPPRSWRRALKLREWS